MAKFSNLDHHGAGSGMPTVFESKMNAAANDAFSGKVDPMDYDYPVF